MARATKLANDAFSHYIIARDKYCVTCGSNYRLQCSHVFRRTHHATIWHEFNAYAQCAACHVRHYRQSESYLLDYARRRIGDEAYKDLRDNWNTTSHRKVYQVEEIARFYTEKARALRNGK